MLEPCILPKHVLSTITNKIDILKNTWWLYDKTQNVKYVWLKDAIFI